MHLMSSLLISILKLEAFNLMFVNLIKYCVSLMFALMFGWTEKCVILALFETFKNLALPVFFM